MPSVGDAVSFEGGQLLNSTCRGCGLTSPPVVFDDRAAWEQFRAERAALYKPDAPAFPEAPTLPPLEPVAPSKPPGSLARALGTLMGVVFVGSALLSIATAAQVGGAAWATLGPSAFVALLLGVPMLLMGRRRA